MMMRMTHYYRTSAPMILDLICLVKLVQADISFGTRVMLVITLYLYPFQFTVPNTPDRKPANGYVGKSELNSLNNLKCLETVSIKSGGSHTSRLVVGNVHLGSYFRI